jgi:AcrR family transcriptional regulator
VHRRGDVRERIVASARKLFAERGYANTSIPNLASAAGVTRGALYFYFNSKQALFAEVFANVARDLFTRTFTAAAQGSDLRSRTRNAREAFLDSCLEPEVCRIVLIDGRSVLTAAQRREIRSRLGFARGNIVQPMLTALMQMGEVPNVIPVEPMSTVLEGVFEAAAIMIAESEDKPKTRAQISGTLNLFFDALLTYAAKLPPK